MTAKPSNFSFPLSLIYYLVLSRLAHCFLNLQNYWYAKNLVVSFIV